MIILLNSVFENFKNKIFNFLNVISHRRKFPNSRLSLSSKLYDVNLSGYNVLFENVVLVKSCLGLHTYIQRGSSVINATIGKFCSIAPNVSIGPGIHKIDSVSTHPSFFLADTPLIKIFSKSNQFNFSIKTEIGNDVWIGEKVVIVDGVKVGNGAIIASGAIVIKDVEPYSVVGGVPAKHIKYRFDAETIDVIQNSEWWNYSEEWFVKNAELLLNPIDFLKYLKNNGSNN